MPQWLANIPSNQLHARSCNGLFSTPQRQRTLKSSRYIPVSMCASQSSNPSKRHMSKSWNKCLHTHTHARKHALSFASCSTCQKVMIAWTKRKTMANLIRRQWSARYPHHWNIHKSPISVIYVIWYQKKLTSTVTTAHTHDCQPCTWARVKSGSSSPFPQISCLCPVKAKHFQKQFLWRPNSYISVNTWAGDCD